MTDGAFLDNGDLLLVERRLALLSGLAMRIVRVKAGDLRPGAVVGSQRLLEAGMDKRIDNMEGLDVVKAADGSTHLILVSDDNFSILQTSLMLEFRLDP